MEELKSLNIQPDEQLQVEIKRLNDEAFSLPQTLFRVLYYPVILIRQIYNTVLLIRHAELRAPLHKNMCPFKQMNTFTSLFFSAMFTGHPAVMAELFKHPRKDPLSGIFDDQENFKTFMPLLQDMYPDGSFNCDDFILTCHKDKIHLFRQSLLQFIGLNKVKLQAHALERIVHQNLDVWEAQQKTKLNIDLTDASLVFSTHVISELLLGHPGPFEIYQKIAWASTHLNQHMYKKTWHYPFSEEEKQQYREALQIMKDAIHVSLSTTETPEMGSLVQALRDQKGMTPSQIKSTLLIAYFAGAETTASLINYAIWQLGQHPEYQEKIFREISQYEGDLSTQAAQPSIDKLFAESLRLFTPAYVVGRQLADDLICTVKNEAGKILAKEKIRKKDGILIMPTFAARHPVLYPSPDVFNPDRFDNVPRKLPWLPFGDGKHACPGQWLAKMEVVMLIAALVKRYKIQSSPFGPITQQGLITLKLNADTRVILERR